MLPSADLIIAVPKIVYRTYAATVGMVFGPFAETKGPRRRGRNPAKPLWQFPFLIPSAPPL